MAKEATVKPDKTLTDVVDALDHLNSELDQQGADSRRSGAQVVKSGRLGSIFAFFHRRAQKKRLRQTHEDIQSLRLATMEEFNEQDTRHMDNQYQAGQAERHLENISVGGEAAAIATSEISENHGGQLENIEEALSGGGLAGDIGTAIAESSQGDT